MLGRSSPRLECCNQSGPRRGVLKAVPVRTVIGARPPSRREGELLMMLWMAGTELGQSASGVSVSELTHASHEALPCKRIRRYRLTWCVDSGEAVLDSKGRRDILHDLVAKVRALIGEPLQNRNESGEVLVQDVGRGFRIRFLARSQKRRSLRKLSLRIRMYS